jgi:succinate dehydrogenase / fumarate reductase cytochrome b subunit
MSWLLALWRSSIGKKALMAVTGLVLVGFVIGHLLGNLQIFLPDDGRKINEYGRFLHENAALLWGARGFLLACVLVHIVCAVQLAKANHDARPVPYRVREWRRARTPARVMLVSGVIIGLFVIYHLLHFTTGHAHPDFEYQPEPAKTAQAGASDAQAQPVKGRIPDVHHNVTAAFNGRTGYGWFAGLAYVFAMTLLGSHLVHGAWSMFQSVGASHPKYTLTLRLGAAGLAAMLALGNILIPLILLFRSLLSR